MTIASVGTGLCLGCRAPVSIWRDGQREQLRDTERGARPWQTHVCAEPAQRERIEMTLDNLRAFCSACGSPDVAVSTWGRLVECPYTAWMSSIWDEPHQEHVCDAMERTTLIGMPDRNRPQQKAQQRNSLVAAGVRAVDVPEL